MQELGVIGEMRDITEVFSLRTEVGSEFDDTLLVSFVDSSRVFYFSADGDVEELGSYKGLVLDAQTLLATTLPTGHLLQVNPRSVQITDLESGMVTSQWTPPPGSITGVSTTNTHVLVSIEGTLLALLDIMLRDGPCLGVAQELHARKVPFAVYTGMLHTQRYPELRGVPELLKPSTLEDVVRMVDRLHAQRRGAAFNQSD